MSEVQALEVETKDFMQNRYILYVLFLFIHKSTLFLSLSLFKSVHQWSGLFFFVYDRIEFFMYFVSLS